MMFVPPVKVTFVFSPCAKTPLTVPEILFSGNHKKIEEWKLKKSIEITKARRPDIYEKFVNYITTKDN